MFKCLWCLPRTFVVWSKRNMLSSPKVKPKGTTCSVYLKQTFWQDRTHCAVIHKIVDCFFSITTIYMEKYCNYAGFFFLSLFAPDLSFRTYKIVCFQSWAVQGLSECTDHTSQLTSCHKHLFFKYPPWANRTCGKTGISKCRHAVYFLSL